MTAYPFHRRQHPGTHLTALAVVGAGAAEGVLAAYSPALAIAPPALVLASWLWVRAPGVLLVCYLFLPFYKGSLGPFSPVDLTPLLALVNAAQFVMLLTFDRPRPASLVGLLLWGSLGLAVLAGILWADQQAYALDRASYWWALILLPSAAAIRVASDDRFVGQFVATAFGLGSAIIVLGLGSLFDQSRLMIFGENTLQTGAITLVAILTTLLWGLRALPVWTRPALVALVGVALAESVATGSRGPLIAFGVALAYALARRALRRHRLTTRDMAVALVGTGGAAVLALTIARLPAESIARLLLVPDAIAGGGSAGTSIGARLDLFSIATAMFAHSPLIGNGTGSFGAYTMSLTGFTQFTYPHNDLLQVAAEYGLIGVVLFVALVVAALRAPDGDDPARAAVGVLFVFMLTLGMTSGDIYGDRLMWGLLVLLLAAAEPAGGEPVRVPTGMAADHRATSLSPDGPEGAGRDGQPAAVGRGTCERASTA